MENRFKVIFAFTLAVLFLMLGMIGVGVTAAETQEGDTPIKFKFGAGDGEADAVVKITMEGKCKLQVTRDAVTDLKEFACLDAKGWYNKSVPIKEPTMPAGSDQYSIYRIKPVDNCYPKEFPMHIEIVNYAEVVTGGGKAFKMRLIHKKADGTCSDITTVVEKGPTPADDGKGGGDTGGKSDFFLVNLHKDSLKEPKHITNKLTKKLEEKIPLGYDGKPVIDPKPLQEANKAINEKRFEDAIKLLTEFETVVQDKLNDGYLSAQYAAYLQSTARQIVFAIRQFMDLLSLGNESGKS